MTATVIRPATEEMVLSLSCPDRPGLIYDISRMLIEHRCDIVESSQFSDRSASSFYLRAQFRSADGGAVDDGRLRQSIGALAEVEGMSWRLSRTGDRPRLLIMVSRFGHCLNDLLFRASSGDLSVEVAAVVSNHPDLEGLADNHGVPFHHIPVTPESKPAAEEQLMDLVDALDVDLLVLARYMQILSPELCKHLEGHAINIHHSMLPSFKGARPYFQAHDRGVKLIGATAHYVTADLDEGPIIEQEIARVDHTMSAEDVTKLGRDNECLALARAVRWHTENRILLDGQRTVVFR
ncbi:MAG TPA: formyltetrahydrofolate deformylase [Pseudonocardia sp.]|jgi:formyltetrahydrofolate deformylase|nr:formyltetrahydrofolate deformylase [Pseudonocardia sp.]